MATTPIDVPISNISNLLIIDTSYYIFHRYYATLKWYTYYIQRTQTQFVDSDEDTEPVLVEKKTIDYANIHKDTAFVEFFKKHFLQDLEKLKKRWKVSSANILFCKDCSRDTIWRNSHHNNYKGTRIVGSTFNGEIFPIFYTFIASNYTCVSLPQLEADDVVYLTVNRLMPLVGERLFTKEIIVITNDNDYLQMRRTDLHLYNLIGTGVNLETRSKGTPEYDLLLKVICGDLSDNILAIAPKIGKKTGEKLANMTESERNAWIAAKGAACVCAYENNKRLVDFRNIPSDLQNAFYDKYNIHCVLV